MNGAIPSVETQVEQPKPVTPENAVPSPESPAPGANPPAPPVATTDPKANARTAAGLLTLSSAQLKERLDRASSATLKKLFGTDNPTEIQGMRAEFDRLKAEAEQKRQAELTETQRLQEQLATEKRLREEAEKRYKGEVEKGTINQQAQRMQGIANGYVDPKYHKHAIRDFAEDMLVNRKMSDKQLAKMGEKEIRAWFAKYAKDNPGLAAKPAQATPRAPVVNGNKGNVRPTTNGKAQPSGQPAKSPKNMTDAEWQEYKRQNNIRY